VTVHRQTIVITRDSEQGWDEETTRKVVARTEWVRLYNPTIEITVEEIPEPVTIMLDEETARLLHRACSINSKESAWGRLRDAIEAVL